MFGQASAHSNIHDHGRTGRTHRSSVISSPDQQAAAGLNSSAVHTDVVVGGPGVDVVGTTRDGRSVELITDDTWVLPLLP